MARTSQQGEGSRLGYTSPISSFTTSDIIEIVDTDSSDGYDYGTTGVTNSQQGPEFDSNFLFDLGDLSKSSPSPILSENRKILSPVDQNVLTQVNSSSTPQSRNSPSIDKKYSPFARVDPLIQSSLPSPLSSQQPVPRNQSSRSTPRDWRTLDPAANAIKTESMTDSPQQFGADDSILLARQSYGSRVHNQPSPAQPKQSTSAQNEQEASFLTGVASFQEPLSNKKPSPQKETSRRREGSPQAKPKSPSRSPPTKKTSNVILPKLPNRRSSEPVRKSPLSQEITNYNHTSSANTVPSTEIKINPLLEKMQKSQLRNNITRGPKLDFSSVKDTAYYSTKQSPKKGLETAHFSKSGLEDTPSRGFRALYRDQEEWEDDELGDTIRDLSAEIGTDWENPREGPSFKQHQQQVMLRSHFQQYDWRHSFASRLFDPDTPIVLGSFMQILFNTIVLGYILYFLHLLVSTVRHDVDMKVEEYSAEIITEMSMCSKEYIRNNCMPGKRVPALEKMCTSWEKCMNRDPAIVGRAKVSAETFGEIFNGFVKPISYKTMIFMTIVIGGTLALTNNCFGYTREGLLGRAWAATKCQTTPKTPRAPKTPKTTSTRTRGRTPYYTARGSTRRRAR